MPNTAAESVPSGFGSKARVRVAVGVILNPERNRVLVTKRAEGAHQGGLWEFPGGKVEVGEDVQGALSRELHEELCIRPLQVEPLLVISHDYWDKQVMLEVWLVERFAGQPEGREGQPLRWVAVDELDELEFPPANAAILAQLQRRF